MPNIAAHNSASKFGVCEGRDLEKQPLPEMPATRRGVASQNRAKMFGHPRKKAKAKQTFWRRLCISLRGPKGLRLKKIRLESELCNINWSYQTLINDLAKGTTKHKIAEPHYLLHF